MSVDLLVVIDFHVCHYKEWHESKAAQREFRCCVERNNDSSNDRSSCL